MEDVVFESLPVNIEPDKAGEMTEYAKRMKRAARFGLDPSKVAGPQAKLVMDDQEGGQDEAMVDYTDAVNKMEMIQGSDRVDKINK